SRPAGHALFTESLPGGVRFAERQNDSGSLEAASVLGKVTSRMAIGAQPLLNVCSAHGHPASPSMAFNCVGNVPSKPELRSAGKCRHIVSAKIGQVVERSQC